MKTKLRQDFFSHFFMDRNDTLIMLVFLNYFQYWIYTKISVQHGAFPWAIEILNNITKVVIKRISYICAWTKTFPILSYVYYFFDGYFIREELFNWFLKLWLVIRFCSKILFFGVLQKRLHINCVVFSKQFGKHHVYLWENHYLILIITAFLNCFVTKLAWFALKYFFVIGACMLEQQLGRFY